MKNNSSLFTFLFGDIIEWGMIKKVLVTIFKGIGAAFLVVMWIWLLPTMILMWMIGKVGDAIQSLRG